MVCYSLKYSFSYKNEKIPPPDLTHDYLMVLHKMQHTHLAGLLYHHDSLEQASNHVGEPQTTRCFKRPLDAQGPADDQQETEAFSIAAARQWNSANRVSLEVGSSTAKLLDKSSALAGTLEAVLYGTQLSHAETPDHRNCRKQNRGYFKPLCLQSFVMQQRKLP